jgi:hypothetical protein
MDLADRLFTVFSGLAVLWLAFLLLRVGVRPGWPSLLLVVFWVFFTYLALPRLHRILTRIYVPAYFIGRTRTSDGLLGDPVNLALRGGEAQVHHAMTSSGWIRADDLDLRAGTRIVLSTVRRRSYPTTSPTSVSSRAARPSATTCGSGGVPTTGCCPVGSRSTGSRPAPSTAASGCRCSPCR